MKCTEPIIKLDSVLQLSLELIMRANRAVGKQVFKAKILIVLPKLISILFLIPEECSTITPQMKRFNIIRGHALSRKMIQDLAEKHVILRSNDDDNLCLHPADFTRLFAKIRANISLIVHELINMSLNKYNEFPMSKNGPTISSSSSLSSSHTHTHRFRANLRNTF